MKSPEISRLESGVCDDTVQASNRIAAHRAERLKHAIKMAGGNNQVSARSGVPLGTLGYYLRGRDFQTETAIALAEACGVSLEWLATGNGDMVPQAPVAPDTSARGGIAERVQAPLAPPRSNIDPEILAKAIDFVDAILQTSGRPHTKLERARRIVNAYELAITLDDELPPLPQIVSREPGA